MRYSGGMPAVTLRPNFERRRVPRDPDFRLETLADSRRGERFVIVIAGVGRYPEPSKPLTESDARKVLHKMRHPAAVIDAMVARAKAAQPK